MYKLKNYLKILISVNALNLFFAATSSPAVSKAPCKGKEIDLLWNSFESSLSPEKTFSERHFIENLDKYDARADFNSFIRKLRIPYSVPVKNRSSHDTIIYVELKSQDGSIETEEIIIRSGEDYLIEQNGSQLQSIILQRFDHYLNPKWSKKGFLQIYVETTQDRFFLHQYYPFSFEARGFTHEELDNPNLSYEVVEWMKQFNGNLSFVDTHLGQPYRLNLKTIEQHRRSLYDKNNIARILKDDPLAIDRSINKIPLITHKIWVTSAKKPRALSKHNIAYLEQSIRANPTSERWKHFLWIESREKLPDFAKMIDAHPHIILMEIKDIEKSFLSGDLYKKAIETGQFGKATDILRLEILLQFGGYYLDTDYELFQSLKPYSKIYDMVTGIEPMSAFLCNAFIGSRPNHPVLHTYLELIIKNLRDSKPSAEKNSKENGYKTIIETGPAMLTLAFALSGGINNNIDIALPPMLLFPSQLNTYPCKAIVTPQGPVPAESIGAHYWETSWMNPELGSKG